MSNTLSKITALAIALFFISYAGYQTFRFFFTTYTTENAYIFEVARVYTTQGVLVREEKELTQGYNGVIRYTVPEGGKIITTTPIAELYSNSEDLSKAEQSELILQEKNLLDKLEQSKSSSIKKDLGYLNDNILTTLRGHGFATSTGKVLKTQETRLNLIDNITRSQIGVGNKVDFSQRQLELTENYKTPSSIKTISGGDRGYFSRFVDGYEDDYTIDMIDDITFEEYDQMMGVDYTYDQTKLGKCINNHNWYYVTTVPAEESLLFQPGTKMEINFVGSDELPISGWVKSIQEDRQRGEALLVIQSNDINSETVSRRKATIQLGFDDYKGIRFSKKALRIQDGKKGVFVKGKSSIVFKEVDIVYTGKDFYLSRLDYNSDINLNIFDEIIVEGSNLYHGKVLE